MLMALTVAAGFAVLAPVFTPIFYGKGFSQPLQVFALIGALQSARYLRVWPTTVANGVGRSSVILYNNIARMIGLPIALLANMLFHSLESIVLGFIVGEAAAMVAAFWLLSRTGALDFGREMTRVASFLAGCTAFVAGAWAIQVGMLSALPFVAVAVVGLCIFLARSEQKVLRELAEILRRRLRPKGPTAA